jgi:hypothetical protein
VEARKGVDDNNEAGNKNNIDRDAKGLCLPSEQAENFML